MPKAASLEELHRLCQDQLSRVRTTLNEAEQVICNFHLPLTPEVELQLQKHWQRQFSAWNEYAATARRLAAFVHLHRTKK